MKLIFLLACMALTPNVYAQNLIDALKPRFQVKANEVHKLQYKNRSVPGQGQIIAVLDSGVNYLQPHISKRMAVNSKEISDDQIDNDRNGYIDDVRGWNFFHNNGIVIDDHGHGTHVTGTIVGERYGIAPQASIVPVKVTVTPAGEVSTQHMINGIKYAVDNGAKIINLSLRGIFINMPITQYAVREAIEYARQRNVLIVAAAGNDGSDITGLPVYPATIKSDNLITVCAVDDQKGIASFSNFSSTDVDLCAPGVEIASANKNYDPFLRPNESEFISMSGTSMATPVVTGVAALIWSMEPTLSASEIKDIIIKSAQSRRHETPGLHYYSKTGSVINAWDAACELMKRKGLSCTK